MTDAPKTEPKKATVVVLCPQCHQPMAALDVVEQSAQGPRIEFLQCQQGDCGGRKVAVLFELSAELAPPEPGFVEREVARRGAFFPSDYGGARTSPRNW